MKRPLKSVERTESFSVAKRRGCFDYRDTNYLRLFLECGHYTRRLASGPIPKRVRCKLCRKVKR